MAEALVRGLLASGVAPAERIRVSDPVAARREHMTNRYRIDTTDDNASLSAWAELVVVAVKPQAIDSALASASSALNPDALVVSIVAGVTIERLERQLADGTHVVRAMPNTPALALAGASAIAPGRHCDEGDLSVASSLFGAVGRCVQVAESGLDAVTGLSGSGPAYVMLFIEALADGGVRAGLSRDTAMLLAAQTLFGSAKLHLDTGEHPGVLKDRVTSPGGTTIAGLSCLERLGVRGALIAAVEAAAQRSRELAKS